MKNQTKILIVQTAFIGDVILTLPLIQLMAEYFRNALIDIIVIPRSSDLLRNHRDINKIILYDKHTSDKGIKGLLRLVKFIRNEKYDLAIIPHRSLRSALIPFLSSIKKRIGFNKSAGKIFFTNIVKYEKNLHEIDRNIMLLKPLCISNFHPPKPHLYPDDTDILIVKKALFEEKVLDLSKLIGVAPGSVWNTKRWPKEGYIQLIKKLISNGYSVCLIGGREDIELCDEINSSVQLGKIFNLVGKLSLLQSAELIRKCKVLITNDSAPIHIAGAVGTPVVAIFGPTVPSFGFAPIGEFDRVVEVKGLKCRPCSIHGGKKCPIGGFDCMLTITHEVVYDQVVDVYCKSNELW